MNKTSKLASAAYKTAAEAFTIIIHPVSLHVLSHLEKRRELTVADMTTSSYNTALLLKYIRKMESIQLIRRNRLGNEITFRLNYDRLETINNSAARLL